MPRRYASPIFQHRHYAEIASALRWAEDRPAILDKLESLFQRDNSRFDAARFRAACAGLPLNGKDKR